MMAELSLSLEVWLIALTIVSILVSSLGLFFSFLALSMCYGLRHSTHKAHLIPMEKYRQALEKQDEAAEETLNAQVSSLFNGAIKDSKPNPQKFFGLTKERLGDEIV